MKSKVLDSEISIVDNSLFHKVRNVEPETINDDGSTNSGHSVFLRVCSDIGFFFVIIPFRLKSDGSVSTNKVQKILCGLAYVSTVYRYLTEIRQFPIVNSKQNVVNYFIFSQKVASTIYHTVLMKILWFDLNKFRRLNSFLCKSETLPVKRTWVSSKFVPLIICTIYILMGIATFIFGTRIIEGLSYQNPTWFYRRTVAQFRYMFFISNQANSSIAPEWKDISIGDHFGAAFFSFNMFSRCVIGYYWNSIIFMACLTLWLPAIGFADEIKTQLQLLRNEDRNNRSSNSYDDKSLKNINILEILSKYKELKVLAKLINETLQYAVLTNMMENILYYSIYLDAILVAPDWFRQLRIAISICGVGTMMSIASNICQRVDTMREWLAEDEICRVIPPIKTTILLDELRTNPVSISGQVFSINYSFLGMVGSTLITYFIVVESLE